MTLPPQPQLPERLLGPAIRRGFAGHCPACGEGRLFTRFLKPAMACTHCGEALDGHQADDFPSYIVILLLGHIIVPTMIEVNIMFAIPVGWQALIWPSFAAILAVALIQPVKGGVIAYQWARRMHGFARARPAGS